MKKHADGESEEEEIVNRSCLWLCFSICFYSVLKLNWIRLLWLEVGRARPKFKEIDIYFTDSTPAKLEEVCVVGFGGGVVPLFIVYRPWARPSSQQFCGHGLLLTSDFSTLFVYKNCLSCDMEWKLDFLWLRGELDILPETFVTKPTVTTVIRPSTSAKNIRLW